MPDWPRFQCHKIVQAAPISFIGDVAGEPFILVKPYGNHDTERFMPTDRAMLSHAELGGYAVIYPDGFRSISPKTAFDAGYSKIP